MSDPGQSSPVPTGLARRFIWAITPLAAILLSLGAGCCAVVIGGAAWSDLATMRRATKAREVIVPGMTLEQARAASGHLGEIVLPQSHQPGPLRAVFWAHGGVLAGNYSVAVVLDDRQRVVRTEPP